MIGAQWMYELSNGGWLGHALCAEYHVGVHKLKTGVQVVRSQPPVHCGGLSADFCRFLPISAMQDDDSVYWLN